MNPFYQTKQVHKVHTTLHCDILVFENSPRLIVNSRVDQS